MKSVSTAAPGAVPCLPPAVGVKPAIRSALLGRARPSKACLKLPYRPATRLSCRPRRHVACPGSAGIVSARDNIRRGYARPPFGDIYRAKMQSLARRSAHTLGPTRAIRRFSESAHLSCKSTFAWRAFDPCSKRTLPDGRSSLVLSAPSHDHNRFDRHEPLHMPREFMATNIEPLAACS